MSLDAFNTPDAVACCKADLDVEHVRLDRKWFWRRTPRYELTVNDVLRVHLSFETHVDDFADVEITYNGSERPSGEIIFDSAMRVLYYTPSKQDLLPFDMKLTARDSKGRELSAVIGITPRPRLKPEFELPFTSKGARLDESSSVYWKVDKTRGPNGTINYRTDTEPSYNYFMTGKTILLDSDDSDSPLSYLRSSTNEPRFDINKLVIHAERVIVRSPVVIPHAELEIRTKLLRFERDGHFNVQPRTYSLKPPGYPDIQDGRAGLDARDVRVWTYDPIEVDDLNSNQTRFITSGGCGSAGSPPYEGDAPVWRDDWGDTWFEYSQPGCSIYHYHFDDHEVTDNGAHGRLYEFGAKWRGTSTWEFFPESINNGPDNPRGVPPRPGAPVSGGAPGNGGRGGSLILNQLSVSISDWIDVSGGCAGSLTPSIDNWSAYDKRGDGRSNCKKSEIAVNVHVEGIGSHAEWCPRERTIWYPCVDHVHLLDAGKSVDDPDRYIKSTAEKHARPGSAGNVTFATEKTYHWISLDAMDMIIKYAKHAYLRDDFASVEQDMRHYTKALLDIVKYNISSFDITLARSKLSEIETMLERYDEKLDYFGNPAGYIPLLSLEASMSRYVGEMSSVVRSLYLEAWFGTFQGQVVQSAQLVKSQIQASQKEVAMSIERFNSAQLEVSKLSQFSIDLENEQALLQKAMNEVMHRIENDGRRNVQNKKIAKFFCSMLSKLASVVPTGQPGLGAAVGFVSDISKRLIDREKILVGETIRGAVDVVKKVRNSNLPTPEEAKRLLGSIRDNIPRNFSLKTPTFLNLERLSELSGRLQSVAEFASNAVRELQIGDAELKAEISRLLQQDYEFQALAPIVQRLQMKVKNVHVLLSGTIKTLTENLNMIISLNTRLGMLYDNRDSLLQVSSNELATWIRHRGELARDRIVRFSYIIKKAYEYLMLEPVELEPRLDDFVVKLQELAGRQGAKLPSYPDFDAITRAIYDETILNRVINNLYEQQKSILGRSKRVVEIDLSLDELRQLTENGYAKLDLYSRNMHFPGDQDMRVISVDFVHFDYEVLSRPEPPTLMLKTFHGKTNIVEKSGRKYRFMNPFTYFFDEPGHRALSNFGVEEDASHLYLPGVSWNAICDTKKRTLINEVRDVGGTSVLTSLLGQRTEDIQFRPSYMGDWYLTYGFAESYDAKIRIDRLTIRFNVSVSPLRTDWRKLHIQTVSGANGDKIEAPVIIDREDVNGRTSGYGDISRFYTFKERVEVKVGEFFGVGKFVGWKRNLQDQTLISKDRVINVELSSAISLIAIYQ